LIQTPINGCEAWYIDNKAAETRASSGCFEQVMRINPKLRISLLIGALALTLVAVRWIDTVGNVTEASAGAASEPVARVPRPVTGQPAPALDLRGLHRSPGLDPDGDPFEPRSFRPAPAKVSATPEPVALAAPPPPPPQAPPLPFTYIGRLSADLDTTVFLAMGERYLVLKPGDVIDNTYKLEEVSDSALVLTYLPLSQRQRLSIATP
jgi:hypothetical protein